MAMFDYDMKDAVVNNTLTGPMKGGLYENLAACVHDSIAALSRIVVNGRSLPACPSKTGRMM